MVDIIRVLAAFIAVRIVFAFYKYFLRSGKNLRSYGEWAIITGATDGIGKAFAQECAKRKLNVFLISRNPELLSQTAMELESKYSVKTKTLAVDFGNFTDLKERQVQESLKDLDVGLLINNVGASYDHPEFATEIDEKTIDKLVNLNIHSTYRMTRAVLPSMLGKAKPRGAIVNMSSFASEQSVPMLAYYAATKGFVDKYSEALHWEVKSKGIHVQVQRPMFIKTKMSKTRESLMIPRPEKYAKAAMKHIGYEAVSSPYWVHALIQYVINLVPKNLRMRLLLSEQKGIRQKALNKKAREASGGSGSR